MLLFVAHDPGARKHVLPLFEYGQAQGLAARFIDLAAPQHAEPRSVFQNKSIGLLVTGWSVNQAEWPWVLAAREVPTCRVSVTGNPYLEWLIESQPAAMEAAGLERIRGCKKNFPLVSVFLPDFGAPAGSLNCLVNLLGQSALAGCRPVIRPHPRDPQRNCAQTTNRDLGPGGAVWDWECRVSTPALLAASVCSLTYGSTVYMDSLALGIPSAYLQIGWEYKESDRLYANHSSVPRLRYARELFEFVSVANTCRGSHTKVLVENYLGATVHAWAAFQKHIFDN